MQAGLFAKKVGMTQIFDESGAILPVTILKTGLCQVSQIKTVITDGYNAVQVAYGEKKLENINKNYYFEENLEKYVVDCSNIQFIPILENKLYSAYV